MARHQIIVTSGKNEMTLDLSCETYALMIKAWQRLERETGAPVTFNDLMRITSERLLAKLRDAKR